MRVEPSRAFNRQLRQISDPGLRRRIQRKIAEPERAASLSEVTEVSRMRSSRRNRYRIRIGEYRLGIIVEGERVILAELMTRGEIYRYFR